MTDLVRKGALARDRIERDPEVAVACDDLARLADLGALAGVAEVIRERLRQIEVKGHTPWDDENSAGFFGLDQMACRHLTRLRDERRGGTADIGSDEDHLRKVGALVAAEIDRVIRTFSVRETAEILADPGTTAAIREGESDLR